VVRKLILVAAVAWAIFVVVVNGSYLTGHPKDRYSDPAYTHAGMQQIDNPNVPVMLSPQECTSLFRYALHYTISDATARQWHTLTAVLLLAVVVVSWPRRLHTAAENAT